MLLEDGIGEYTAQGDFVDVNPIATVEMHLERSALLRHISLVLDHAEVNGIGAQTGGVPVAGESIEEDISRCVFRPAFVADDAGHTGGHGEEVQGLKLLILGYEVQVRSAGYLRMV